MASRCKLNGENVNRVRHRSQEACMNAFRIFRRLVRDTGIYKVVITFVVFFIISAFVILENEPQIETYGDACWYCFALISTCGFGDITVYSVAARVMSAMLSCFAVVVIAMLTGVIVNMYNKLIELRVRGTLTEMMDKLEHLSELSKEELNAISERVKKLS